MMAEMLVNDFMLLEKKRKFGEILTEEDLLKIDGEILRALENQKIIRILQNIESDTINSLLERVDKLEAKVFAPPRRGRPPKEETGD